jgi:succinoglycan biosynthesis transport protein ExoP
VQTLETSQDFDIKKYTDLLYKRRYVFVAVVAVITTIAIVVSYVKPKIYEAKSTVLIESNYVNELMKGIGITSIDDRVKAIEVMMKSRPLLVKVLGDLDPNLTKKSEAEVERLVQLFKKRTEIKIMSARNDMDMFAVSLSDGDPAFARDYVNTLIRRYIEEGQSHKRNETYGANKFLTEQIDLFKEKISTIERNIAQLRKEQNLVPQERLPALQQRLNELLVLYTGNHPEVLKVKAEIETLKNLAKDSKQTVDSEKTGDKDDATSLTQEKGIARSATKQGERIKLSELVRERDAYQKIYQDLVATLGRSEVSSQIESQDKSGTFKVLEPALLPLKPVSPSRIKIMLLGLFAGIGGGFGFIILLDSMDKSIKTLDTLKTFGVPVLAVIPHIQDPAEIKKTRRNDLFLYTVAGAYLLCLAGLLAFEFLKKGLQ